ncbi:MAG: type secretion C-terminal target protein, partial [Caulobacteraceae bacterium]|nr:type secretion C-terminal target protein [Caulobacteraceae bacterium]
AGAHVDLKDHDGHVIAQATADGGGAFSLTPSSDLAQGEQVLSVVATDAYGNVGAAGTADVTIDSVAPGAPVITSPGGVDHTTAYSLTGTAEAGAAVAIYDGASLVGGDVADAFGAWSLDLAGLSEGVHTFSAQATDEAGNVSAASAGLAVNIDAAGPPLTVGQALAADTGASATDLVTNDGHVVLSGATSAGAVVRVYDGATLLGQTTANGSGAWTLAKTLAAGGHTLSATATLGGAVTYSDPLATIVVDKTGPAVAITSQTLANDTGASATDGVTSDGHVQLAGSSEAGAAVDIFDGAVRLGGAVAAPDGSWTYVGVLADGTHRLSAHATDLAGNVTASAMGAMLTVDTTGPAFAITGQTLMADTGASAGDNVTNNGRVTLSGTGEAGAMVSIFDGATKLTTVAIGAGGTWAYSATLAEGAHALSASAADKAGNTTAGDAQATITVDKTAPTAVAIATLDADGGPLTSGAFTNDATLGLSGTASEIGGAVEVLRNGVVVATTTVAGDGHWSVAPGAALADGAYSYAARVSDLAGNTRTSTGVAVTIDTVGPAAPSIVGITSDTGASAADGVTKDNTLQVRGTAEAGATVTLYQDGVAVGSAVANGAGAWTVTDPNVLADATFAFTSIAVDKAGNASGASGAFTAVVDIVAAPAAIDGIVSHGAAILAGGFTNSGGLDLSGHAEAGSSVAVSATGKGVIGTVIADGAGAWSLHYDAVGDGKYNFTAKATDLAGNMASAAGFAVTLDTVISAPELRTLAQTATQTTLGGVAEAGAVVQVFEGASLLGTATANSSGAWSLKIAKLSDLAVHTLSVDATDKAGNLAHSAGDAFIGRTANDAITGGGGHDVLLGSAGNDRLDGGANSDLLTGGTGNDTFVFTATQAHNDTVSDFATGADRLEFHGYSLATAAVTSLGGGDWLVSDGVVSDVLHLTGVATLAAGDYVFL